jgi:hypothetical protein
MALKVAIPSTGSGWAMGARALHLVAHEVLPETEPPRLGVQEVEDLWQPMGIQPNPANQQEHALGMPVLLKY